MSIAQKTILIRTETDSIVKTAKEIKNLFKKKKKKAKKGAKG